MKQLIKIPNWTPISLVLLVSIVSGFISACDKFDMSQIAEKRTLINTINISLTGKVPLLVGKDTLLQATYSPEEVTNAELLWYSADESIARVDQQGKVTAIAAGKTTITVQSVDGGLRRSTVEIEVISEIIYAETITLNPLELSLFEEVKASVSVTFAPENTTYKHVRWSSSDESVATVNANGEITGISKGTATITVHALDGSGVIGILPVRVSELIPIQDIVLIAGHTEVFAEKEVRAIEFSVLPTTAAKQFVAWTSSNEEVATVDGNGVITAKGLGEAIITAKSTDGNNITKSFTIKVEEGKINDYFRVGVSHPYVTPTNGASLEVRDNALWVTMNTGGNNRRGDFRRPNTKLHVGNYPIIAFKFTRPLPTAGNIFFDTNLGRWRQVTGNGNNQMAVLTGRDGMQVFYADMGTYNTFGTGATAISTTQAHSFSQIGIGVADFPAAQNPLSPFPVYWVKTFKNIAELQAYINQ